MMTSVLDDQVTEYVIDSPTDIVTITSVDDLREIPSGACGTYHLANDIDFQGITDFIPIVNFGGIFNGNDCTIRNYTNTQNGLFENILSTGKVNDLSILCTIEQNGETMLTEYSIGGLVGKNEGEIKNCSAKSVLHTNATCVGQFACGGLVGYNIGGIKNCYSRSDVSLLNTDYVTSGTIAVGGLVGASQGNDTQIATITNAYAIVTIRCNSTENVVVGGLVGLADLSQVMYSYSNASISSIETTHYPTQHIGSFIGENNSYISHCFSVGKLRNENELIHTLGFIGLDTGNCENSFIYEYTSIEDGENSYFIKNDSTLAGTGNYGDNLVTFDEIKTALWQSNLLNSGGTNYKTQDNKLPFLYKEGTTTDMGGQTDYYIPSIVPSKIEAENYNDMHGNIRVVDCNDVDGGKELSNLAIGDYTKYEVSIPEDGYYVVQYRVSGYNGTIKMYCDDGSMETTTMQLAGVGLDSDWTTVNQQVYLKAGLRLLKFEYEPNFVLNWIGISKLETKDIAIDVASTEYAEANGGNVLSNGWLGYLRNNYVIYPFNIPHDGYYKLSYHTNGSGNISLYTGEIFLASTPVSGTGIATTSGAFPMRVGQQDLKLVFNATGGSILEIGTIRLDPFANTIIPGRIEAEDYIRVAGTVQTSYCNDIGNGSELSNISNYDMSEYSIDVQQAGDYVIEYRASGQNSQIKAYVNDLLSCTTDINLMDELDGNWTTIRDYISLAAGIQTLKLEYRSGIAINWIAIHTLEQLPVLQTHSSSKYVRTQGGIQQNNTVKLLESNAFVEYFFTIPTTGYYTISYCYTSVANLSLYVGEQKLTTTKTGYGKLSVIQSDPFVLQQGNQLIRIMTDAPIELQSLSIDNYAKYHLDDDYELDTLSLSGSDSEYPIHVKEDSTYVISYKVSGSKGHIDAYVDDELSNVTMVGVDDTIIYLEDPSVPVVGVTYANNVWTFQEGSEVNKYTVVGTTTTDRIVIPNGIGDTTPLDITLHNASMMNARSPIELQGNANVNLHLADETVNTLTSTATDNNDMNAGLHVASGATLTVDGPGTLNAQGGSHGPGIGTTRSSAGTINIYGGTVNATGGHAGAGVGTGYINATTGSGSVSYNITIGGNAVVNATGKLVNANSNQGAGIGAGCGHYQSSNTVNAGTITIKEHAVVVATGGNNAAGIGGGQSTNSGTINIEDSANVTATSVQNGAGIGGGWGGTSNSITIGGMATVTTTGGAYGSGVGGGSTKGAESIVIKDQAIVSATGGLNGAGIGGGFRGAGGTINIEGNPTVIAHGNQGGAGIGSGLGDGTAAGAGGDIHISGGSVSATGSDNGAGIGGGGNCPAANVSIAKTASVTAVSVGTKPAIDDVDGVNGETSLANVVNATLATPVSTTEATTLKLSDPAGSTFITSEIALPVNYKNFATTTGTYTGSVAIDAYDANGTIFLGDVVRTDNGDDVTSGESLASVGATLLGRLIDLSNPTNPVAGVTYANNTFTFNEGSEASDYTVVGTTTTARIVIPNGIGDTTPLDITLNNASMMNARSPIELQGNANVNLHLADETVNTLTSTATDNNNMNAGLHVASGATLTVDGPGTLNAQGGSNGPGIGTTRSPGGTINIYGGKVNATGGHAGAGVGTGYINAGTGSGSVSYNITIGGNAVVNATGKLVNADGNQGAGIGAGCGYYQASNTVNTGTITIKEYAVVFATGGNNAAGIGGGQATNGGTINIEGGTVEASGGSNAAGIGSGNNGVSGNVSISEIASVTAVSVGTKPAIEDTDGLNESTSPANVVNATLDVAVSTTETTILKSSNSGESVARDITLPANYKSFAATTGIYAGDVAIDVYEANGTIFLGDIVRADNENDVVSGVSLVNVGVKRLNRVIDLNNPTIPVVGVTYANNTFTFNEGSEASDYTVVGTTTTARIVVPTGVGTESDPLEITLENASMTTGYSPIELQGNANVNLHVEGVNTVMATQGSGKNAGIIVPEGTTLTIDGSGTLTATAGALGAGIGTGQNVPKVGRISIEGDVTVNATGGHGGAGIGTGYGGNVHDYDITIRGNAVVNASSANYRGASEDNQGAGIGSSAAATTNNGTVTIEENATVNATGAKTPVSKGAGIGGGNGSSGGTININGGTVTATGGNNASGIGGGSGGAAGNVSISDTANVTAVSTGAKPAIEDADGENDATIPTNVVNATLDTPISTTEATILRVSDVAGATSVANDITLPTNYRSFATTTGIYAGEVTIGAFNSGGTSLGHVVKADNTGNIVSGNTLVTTSAILKASVTGVVLDKLTSSIEAREVDTLAATASESTTSENVTLWSSDETVTTDGHFTARCEVSKQSNRIDLGDSTVPESSVTLNKTTSIATTSTSQAYSVVNDLIPLTKGFHSLKLVYQPALPTTFNLTQLFMTPLVPHAVNVTIHAMDTVKSSGGRTIDGNDIGFLKSGDFLEYCIHVPEEGYYTVSVSVKRIGNIQLLIGDELLYTFDSQNSGHYTTITSPYLKFSKGDTFFRLVVNAPTLIDIKDIAVHSYTQYSVDTIIEAENYLQKTESITTSNCNDQGTPSVQIGNLTADSYTEYSLTVDTEGEYLVQYRVSGYGGEIQCYFGDSLVSTTLLQLAGSGFDQYWMRVNQIVYLTPGTKSLRFLYTPKEGMEAGFTINWFNVTTYVPTYKTEQLIPAYDFIESNGGNRYGEENIIGWFEQGMWMKYRVVIEQSSKYIFSIRAAAHPANVTFTISNETAKYEVTIQVTGNLATYLSTTPIDIASGTYIITLSPDAKVDVEWFRIDYYNDPIVNQATYRMRIHNDYYIDNLENRDADGVTLWTEYAEITKNPLWRLEGYSESPADSFRVVWYGSSIGRGFYAPGEADLQPITLAETIDFFKIVNTSSNKYKMLTPNSNYTKVVAVDSGRILVQRTESPEIVADYEWIFERVFNTIHMIPKKIPAEQFEGAEQHVYVDDSSDIEGGKEIGGFVDGSFTEYAVEVHESATYRIKYRICGMGPGQIKCYADGMLIKTTDVNLDVSVVWTTINDEIYLNENTKILKFLYSPFNPLDDSYYVLSYFNITFKPDAPGSDMSILAATDFVSSNGGVPVDDPDMLIIIKYFKNNSWLKYRFHFTTLSSYRLKVHTRYTGVLDLRITAPGVSPEIRKINCQSSGWGDSFSDLITIPAGTHEITLTNPGSSDIDIYSLEFEQHAYEEPSTLMTYNIQCLGSGNFITNTSQQDVDMATVEIVEFEESDYVKWVLNSNYGIEMKNSNLNRSLYVNNDGTVALNTRGQTFSFTPTSVNRYYTIYTSHSGNTRVLAEDTSIVPSRLIETDYIAEDQNQQWILLPVETPIHNVPGKIQAEDYISKTDSIRSAFCNDIGRGMELGYLTANSYTEYAVTVEAASEYLLQYRVSGYGGEIRCYSVNKSNATETLLATTTMKLDRVWDVNWTTINQLVQLTADITRLKFVYTPLSGDSYAANLNWINIQPVGVHQIGEPIMATDNIYSNGGYAKLDDGGHVISGFDVSKSMKYRINVAAHGKYLLDIRTKGKANLSFTNGTTINFAISVDSSDWHTTTLTTPIDLTGLTSGVHDLTITTDAPIDIHWLKLYLYNEEITNHSLYYIKNIVTGLYLSNLNDADGGSVDGTTFSDTNPQRWLLSHEDTYPEDTYQVSIKMSQVGRGLDVNGGSVDDGTVISLNTTTQNFQFVKLVTGAYKLLTSNTGYSKVLTMKTGQGKVTQYTDVTSELTSSVALEQQWVIEKVKAVHSLSSGATFNASDYIGKTHAIQMDSGGSKLMNLQAGYFSEYAVSVQQYLKYILKYRVIGVGGQIQCYANDKLVSTTTLSLSGEYVENYYGTVRQEVSFPANTNRLRFVYLPKQGVEDGFHFSSFGLEELKVSSFISLIKAAYDSVASNGGCADNERNESLNGIGWLEDGMWMKFYVHVPTSGYYYVSLNGRPSVVGDMLTISSDSTTNSPPITMGNEGGAYQYKTSTSKEMLYLEQGTNTITTSFHQHFDFQWFTLFSKDHFDLPVSGGHYYIKHVQTGLLIDNYTDEDRDGAPLGVKDYRESAQQRWVLKAEGSDAFKISLQASSSGRGLDVASSGQSDGTAIQLYNTSHTYRIVKVDERGMYKILTSATNYTKCISIDGNGRLVQMTDDTATNPDSNLLWTFTGLKPATPEDQKTYVIRNVHTGKLIDNYTNKATSGQPLGVRDFRFSEYQQWIFRREADGDFTIISKVDGDGLGLNINANSTADGAQIWLYGAAHVFRMVSVNSQGMFKIMTYTVSFTKCVDIDANGGLIQNADDTATNPDSTQLWMFIEV